MRDAVVPHPRPGRGVARTARRRGSVVCGPAFDPDRFLDQLAHWAPTWYTAVPTLHQAILGRISARPGWAPPGTSIHPLLLVGPAAVGHGRNGGGDRGADGGAVWDDRSLAPDGEQSAAAGSSEAGFGGARGGTGGGNPRCRGGWAPSGTRGEG